MIFLRQQKRSSFRAFCESLDPSQGITKICFTLKVLSSRTGALRTRVLTDIGSPEFVRLRDELVREDVPLVTIPLRESGVGKEYFDEPFTRSEFDSAMCGM